ncbi:MAG: hypothetical protein WKF97_21330 [Chitinophagaceae bacterium]
MTFKITLLALFLSCCLACEKIELVKVNQESYPLPGDQFFPEGIAFNPITSNFFTGSTSNGDIVKVNVQTGATNLFASGIKQDRTFCTGMKLDILNRLWVCGGSQGKVFVLESDGSVARSWDLKALYNAGFVNDCIIDNNYVYFTDSQLKKIYRASMKDLRSNIEEWFTFTDQQIPNMAGANANGIEATSDGKYLIVVVSNQGKLFRIDKATKTATEIQLNMPVTSGDGLVLLKNMLYVSRNATGKIFPVTLTDNYTKGTVGDGFGENLLFNTTMAKAGKYFLVVNGQLNRRNPPGPVLPFSVSRVAIP